jgi:hypothetical protein
MNVQKSLGHLSIGIYSHDKQTTGAEKGFA